MIFTLLFDLKKIKLNFGSKLNQLDQRKSQCLKRD